MEPTLRGNRPWFGEPGWSVAACVRWSITAIISISLGEVVGDGTAAVAAISVLCFLGLAATDALERAESRARAQHSGRRLKNRPMFDVQGRFIRVRIQSVNYLIPIEEWRQLALSLLDRSKDQRFLRLTAVDGHDQTQRPIPERCFTLALASVGRREAMDFALHRADFGPDGRPVGLLMSVRGGLQSDVEAMMTAILGPVGLVPMLSEWVPTEQDCRRPLDRVCR